MALIFGRPRRRFVFVRREIELLGFISPRIGGRVVGGGERGEVETS